MDSVNRVGLGVASRWLGLVSALWVQSISGNNYAFSNYSVALKAIMGLNQVQLNSMSVVKDMGKAFGVVSGLVADILPTWVIFLIGSVEGLVGYGAQWLVISQQIRPPSLWMVAGVRIFWQSRGLVSGSLKGYAGLSNAIFIDIATTLFAGGLATIMLMLAFMPFVMSVMLCLGGNSTTWMNTAVLVACVRNFRRSRGPVSGILKGYVGLSTAIFTDIASALFAGDPATFVLMLAIIPFVVCTVAMFLLRPVAVVPALVGSTSQEEKAAVEAKHEASCFAFLNTIAILLAVYLLTYDMIGSHSFLVSRAFVTGLLLLLAAPLCLPSFLWWKASQKATNVHVSGAKEAADSPIIPLLSQQSHNNNAGSIEVGPKVEPTPHADTAEADIGVTIKSRPKIGEDHTIWQALSSFDFWLLFVTFLCGIGTGMAVLNNLGQIAQSFGYSSAAVFISLTSIFGFFGRLGSGAISESCIRSAGVPRSFIMAVSQLPMILGYILLAMGFPGSLYVGSIAVGLCYGVRMAVTVASVSELFGLRIFGLTYNLLILNLPLGSFLFSGLLAGFLYDWEAQRGLGLGLGLVNTTFSTIIPSFNTTIVPNISNGHMYEGLALAMSTTTNEDNAQTCLGVHCYRLVFITMGGVSALGFVLDLILALRTRPLYASLCRAK